MRCFICKRMLPSHMFYLVSVGKLTVTVCVVCAQSSEVSVEAEDVVPREEIPPFRNYDDVAEEIRLWRLIYEAEEEDERGGTGGVSVQATGSEGGSPGSEEG